MSKKLGIVFLAVLAVIFSVSAALAIEWTLEEDSSYGNPADPGTVGYNYRTRLTLSTEYTTDYEDEEAEDRIDERPEGIITVEFPSAFNWLKVISIKQNDLTSIETQCKGTRPNPDYDEDEAERAEEAGETYDVPEEIEYTYYEGNGVLATILIEGVLPDKSDTYTPKFTVKLNGKSVKLEDNEPLDIEADDDENETAKPQMLPVSAEDTKDAYASFDVKTVPSFETANKNYEVYIVIPEAADPEDEDAEPVLKYEISTEENALGEDDIDLPSWLDYEVIDTKTEEDGEDSNLKVLRIYYSSDVEIPDGTVGAVHIGDGLTSGWDWEEDADTDRTIGWNVTFSPSAVSAITPPETLALGQDTAGISAVQGKGTASTDISFNAASLRRLTVNFSSGLQTNDFTLSTKQDYGNGKLTVLVSNPSKGGTYTGTMTVSDNYGMTDKADITITIDSGVTVGQTSLEVSGIPGKIASGDISYTGAAPVDWYVIDPEEGPVDPNDDTYEDDYNGYIEARNEFRETLAKAENLGLSVNLSNNPVKVAITIPEGTGNDDSEYLGEALKLVLVDTYGNEASLDVTFSAEPLNITPKEASLTITAGLDSASASFDVLNPSGTMEIEVEMVEEDDDLNVSARYSGGKVIVDVSADQYMTRTPVTRTLTVSVVDSGRSANDDPVTLTIKVNVQPMPPLNIEPVTSSVSIIAGWDSADASFTVTNPRGAVTVDIEEDDDLNVSYAYSGGKITVNVSADQDITKTTVNKTVTLEVSDSGRDEDDPVVLKVNVTVNPLPKLGVTISPSEVNLIIDGDAAEVTLGTSYVLGDVGWEIEQDDDGDNGSLTFTPDSGEGKTLKFSVRALSDNDVMQGRFTVKITAEDGGREDDETTEVTLTVNVKRIVHVGALDSLEVSTALAGAIKQALSGVKAEVLSIADNSVIVSKKDRTADDIPDDQLDAISAAGRAIAVVLPEIDIAKAGIYTFSVTLDSLDAGTPIFLSIASDDGSEIHVPEDKYAFFDDSNTVIHEVPENKHVTVAVYLEEAGTYSLVITTPTLLEATVSDESIDLKAGGASGTVTLTAENPAGEITWTVSKDTLPDGIEISADTWTGEEIELTISADTTAPAGENKIIITAEDSERPDGYGAVITLTVNVIPKLAITPSAPSAEVIIDGNPASVRLSVNYAVGTIKWAVSPSANGPLVEPSTAEGKTATFRISAEGIEEGEYPVKVTATDGGRDEGENTAEVTITVRVKEAGSAVVTPFTVTASPTAITLQAGGDSESVSLTAGDPQGTVSWTVGTVPEGLTATPLNGTGNTFALTIAASSSATAGSKSITVTATDDGRTSDNTKQVTIAVTVEEAAEPVEPAPLPASAIGKVEIKSGTFGNVSLNDTLNSAIRNILSSLAGIDIVNINDSGSGAVMNPERDASSVSARQQDDISNSGQQVAFVLPEVTVSVTKIYAFSVVLDNLPVRAPIYLSLTEADPDTGAVTVVDASDEEKYAFFDEDYNKITTVPEGNNVIVAAYMEEGNTYSPVITTVADNSEGEGPGEPSGGCSAGFGALALMAALPLFIRRKNA